MTKYRVSFEVEVTAETSGAFQPGCVDAHIVGSDMHAVGFYDLEAVRMLFIFAFQGNYEQKKFGVGADGRVRSTPPCQITRVEDEGGRDGHGQ